MLNADMKKVIGKTYRCCGKCESVKELNKDGNLVEPCECENDHE